MSADNHYQPYEAITSTNPSTMLSHDWSIETSFSLTIKTDGSTWSIELVGLCDQRIEIRLYTHYTDDVYHNYYSLIHHKIVVSYTEL